MFSTPVLLVIFNRPDLLSQVLDSLSQVQPSNLYVAADGPRKGVFPDEKLCKEARNLVGSRVTWNCKIHWLCRDENLGCGKSVSTAVSWFFDQVEAGIVIEDDCVPHVDFYSFCAELLSRYRDQNEIMHIAGVNYQNGKIRGDSSYYFSAYNHSHGWASWRRAWQHFDFNLTDLNEFKKLRKMEKYHLNGKIEKFWNSVFDKMSRKQLDTWDYQWSYSMWNVGGLSITPQKNLISNIGYGKYATHTKKLGPFSNMSTYPIGVVNHPSVIQQNVDADEFTFYSHYYNPIRKRLNYRFQHLLYLLNKEKLTKVFGKVSGN